MDADGINEVLRDVLGNPQTKTINGWVSLNCPLARWTHETGKDSSASAGISINDHGTSIFNCFTCKVKGPLQHLIRKYGEYTGDNYSDLIEELEDEAYLGARTLPEWGARPGQEDPLVPLKKSVYLDLYEPAAGHPYLTKRGISKATARKLQLMVDIDPSDGEERILFPVFGSDGELYGLSGRAIDKNARLKVRDYFGLKKARNLLGAHLIEQTKPDKLLIVEGLFDYANAWECGQPAVAVMHSTLTDPQAEMVRGFALPTYFFYDDDVAGKSGVEVAGKLLYQYVPSMRVRYPKVWIEDESGGHWLSDPGELERHEFEAMIADARLYFP